MTHYSNAVHSNVLSNEALLLVIEFVRLIHSEGSSK
jgi:hypothetical protein